MAEGTEWDKPRNVRVDDLLWDAAGKACRKLRTDRATVMREALEAVVQRAADAQPEQPASKTPRERARPPRTCPKCGSKRLRLEVPPDFEPFEVCKDCGHILDGAP